MRPELPVGGLVAVSRGGRRLFQRLGRSSVSGRRIRSLPPADTGHARRGVFASPWLAFDGNCALRPSPAGDRNSGVGQTTHDTSGQLSLVAQAVSGRRSIDRLMRHARTVRFRERAPVPYSGRDRLCCFKPACAAARVIEDVPPAVSVGRRRGARSATERAGPRLGAALAGIAAALHAVSPARRGSEYLCAWQFGIRGA